MNLREVGALFLVLLTACAGVPRVAHPQVDAVEAQLAAARYELRVLTPGAGQPAPVVVSKQDFQKAMRRLAAEIPLSAQPGETARWLMEGELRADLRADVEGRRVVRLLPLEDGTPLEAASLADFARGYRRLCQEDFGGADCLGLYSDGPELTRKDLHTLALALSLRHALTEAKVALQDMVSPPGAGLHGGVDRLLLPAALAVTRARVQGPGRQRDVGAAGVDSGEDAVEPDGWVGRPGA